MGHHGPPRAAEAPRLKHRTCLPPPPHTIFFFSFICQNFRSSFFPENQRLRQHWWRFGSDLPALSPKSSIPPAYQTGGLLVAFCFAFSGGRL